MKRSAALAWAAACVWCACPAAWAAQLLDVQVTSQPQVTRVQIESDEPLEFQMFGVPDPDRVVLDLSEVKGFKVLESAAARLAGDDPLVKSLRVGRFKPTVLRVVLDLRGEATPHAYRAPDAPKGRHRLVLDLYPPAAPDGVQALLEARRLAGTPPPRTGTGAPARPTEAVALPVTEKGPPADKVAATTAALPAAKPSATTVPVAAPSAVAVTKPAGADATVAPRAERVITVAIDAGHGGEDPGARGHSGTYEKDVTLAIARRLKAAIDATPNMRGVLVRDGDHFVALHQRVVKARSAEADLFVSIHADAFIKPNARGSSVFALSERGATSAAARWLAKKENEADLIGGINLDVPDPNLKKVLLDLSQTATINDSLRLGRAVLSRLSEVNALHKRHVEQAGFAVLKAPDIPSILVETAFISNPEEEKRLNDDAYQERLTQAIADGIRQYFAKNPPLARVARAPGPTAPPGTEPPAVTTLAAIDPPDDRNTNAESAGSLQKVGFGSTTAGAARRPPPTAQSATPHKARKLEAPTAKPSPRADKPRKREVAAASAKPARASASKVATRAAAGRRLPQAQAGARLR